MIPLLGLIQELNDAGFTMKNAPPKVHCRAFEDNSDALEMARVPKMRPRSKHINIKYHHFRDAVAQELITIHVIGTSDQIADILTKPLPEEDFKRHCYSMLRW